MWGNFYEASVLYRQSRESSAEVKVKYTTPPYSCKRHLVHVPHETEMFQEQIPYVESTIFFLKIFVEFHGEAAPGVPFIPALGSAIGTF